VKENLVEVYITDSEFFYNTLNQANIQLPEQVKVIITHEPLQAVPFTTTQVANVHFPRLKMDSGVYMASLFSGKLELKNGYLYAGNAIVIWQPDYFLNDNNGTIEILNRDGKVVARVGSQISMGGGNLSMSVEDINRMIKNPLPPDCKGPFWMQGDGPSLR
jgi:hypothetical protein